MKVFAKKLVHNILGKLDYRLVRRNLRPRPATRFPDIEERFLTKIHERCTAYTMTSTARSYALYQAVRYLVRHGIAGDFVECGVWRGGSTMVAALTLLDLDDTSRNLYLYDTFAGMSEPSEKDIDIHGDPALPIWQEQAMDGFNAWCFAGRDEVEANLRTTGYPMDRFHLVEGRVEETIPQVLPEAVALLRLDTDWYESTYHELRHLFPRLAKNGVLIIDDYGCWRGAREATDRFLAESGARVLLIRVDETCRLGIKTD